MLASKIIFSSSTGSLTSIFNNRTCEFESEILSSVYCQLGEMFDENKLDYLNNRDFCSFSKSSYSPVLELLVVYTKLINVNQRKESLQKDLT